MDIKLNLEFHFEDFKLIPNNGYKGMCINFKLLNRSDLSIPTLQTRKEEIAAKIRSVCSGRSHSLPQREEWETSDLCRREEQGMKITNKSLNSRWKIYKSIRNTLNVHNFREISFIFSIIFTDSGMFAFERSRRRSFWNEGDNSKNNRKNLVEEMYIGCEGVLFPM